MRAVRLAVLLAAASLGACAWLPKLHHFARIKPLPTPALATPINIDDRLYADAVHAIDVRDYGVALDLLQAARDHSANDVRVLNAFGVVYDKLGRFDLSGKFYAQAQALDPNSQIVRQNLAYSALLQGKSRPTTAPMFALVAPPTSPRTSNALIQVAPGVVRLPEAAFQMAVARQLPLITGHPLVLVNASGRSGVAEPVRSELAKLGWTVPTTPERMLVVHLQSEIDYAAAALPAAQALARTLPYKVVLNPCQDGCQGIRLVLGVDAADWGESWRSRAAG